MLVGRSLKSVGLMSLSSISEALDIKYEMSLRCLQMLLRHFPAFQLFIEEQHFKRQCLSFFYFQILLSF